MKKIIIVLILVNFIFGCINCTKQNKKSECNVNKMDLLLRDLFRKKYIFPVIGDDENYTDTARFNYLLSNGLVKQGEVYYIQISPALSNRPDSIKLIPVEQDSEKNKMKNTVGVKLNQTNSDTTDVNIGVGYASIGKYALTNANFNYSFDTVNCKWVMKDSTFWQY